MRVRLVVTGNVQGVGYRALVKIVARNLNVKGQAKNLEDGTVELFCEADEKTLEKFKRLIDRKAEDGDILAVNVIQIEEYREGDKDYISPPGEFGLFDIDYGIETDAIHKEQIERLEIGTIVMQKGFNDLKVEMKTGFGDVGNKIDGVGTKINGVGNKIDSMHQDMNTRFDNLDATYGTFSEKLVSLDNTIKELKDDFKLLVHHYVNTKKDDK